MASNRLNNCSTNSQKLLFIDIETHPAIIASWSIREPHASAVWVERDTFIMCFAAKWAHEKKVKIHALPDYPIYKRDRYTDRFLCMELARYLNEADIVCGHNGDRFDVPLIMGRMFVNKLKPPSPFRTIDTLKVSRRFRLDSHKLDNIGRLTGRGRKRPNTGAHLWRSCSNGDPKAWGDMGKYCGQDTELLSLIYPDLAPWMKNHPGVFDNGCPVCGSDNLHRRGPVRKSNVKFQFVCRDCGHWHVAKL